MKTMKRRLAGVVGCRLSGDRHHDTVGTSICCAMAGSLWLSVALRMIDIDDRVLGKEC